MIAARLDLTLTRGITFGPIKLYFSSNVVGDVTANPANNTFTLANHGLQHNDRIRFRNLGGTLPAGIDAATTYYVVGTPPSNSFQISLVADGPTYVFTDAGTGTTQVLEVADLTGWVPDAEVRTDPEGTLIIDLLPTVTDAAIGEVTIPVITDEQSMLLPADGGKLKAKWDFVFVVPSGDRLGPFLAGSFTIKSIITEPTPVPP